MDRQTLISELVGEAYPPAVEVGSRVRRNWIARTVAVLPQEATLIDLERTVETYAVAQIREAYAATATAGQLSSARPSIALLRLDDHHLIVRVEFAAPEDSVGNAAWISQWGVLQAIDRVLRLDELQGLPRALWFPLRSS
jgi:hypothetical protein